MIHDFDSSNLVSHYSEIECKLFLHATKFCALKRIFGTEVADIYLTAEVGASILNTSRCAMFALLF